MARTRAFRDEPPPGPAELVFRGVLSDTGLDPADLREAAVLNHDLYGFYGVRSGSLTSLFRVSCWNPPSWLSSSATPSSPWLAWPNAGFSCGQPDSGRITVWCTKAMTWKAWSRG